MGCGWPIQNAALHAHAKRKVMLESVRIALSAAAQEGRLRGNGECWTLDHRANSMDLCPVGSGRRTPTCSQTSPLASGMANEIWCPLPKPISGLTDPSFAKITAAFRKNTSSGLPCCAKSPRTTCFESRSRYSAQHTAHKSGVRPAFPRMLRWRQDFKAAPRANKKPWPI